MRNLQDFQVAQSANIFITASQLPAFFSSNLVDPTRVVKIFKNDPQANLRVFYYQYLKLCFEVSDCDFQQYIRKIQDIINDPNFSFVFDQSEDQEVFNDMQFKQLIMEFFGLLSQGDANIQTCLNHYPIIDTVFIYFFRSILILTGATDNLYSYIDRMTLFNSLVEHFNVEVEVHDNCIRFTQTDIFVYEEQPTEVYMAYMENEGEKGESKEYVSQLVSQEVIQEQPVAQLRPAHVAVKQSAEVQGLIAGNPSSRRTKEEGRESYIQGDFLDYTSNSPGLHTLVKTDKLKESGTIDAHHHLKEAPKPQVNTYVPEPIKKPEPVLPYIQAKSEYLSDIGSKSQYSELNNSTNNYLNNLLSKSPNYETSSYKDPLSYTNPVWQPPKEASFGAKTQSNYSAYLPQAKPEIFTPQTNTYTPVSTSNSNQFISNYSATNQYFNQYANGQNNYTPTYSNVKPAYGNSQVDTYLKPDPTPSYKPPVQASFDSKKPAFYDPQPAPKPTSSKPATKNPFNLNVSQEFTNSFTMKLMCQPHRSNISNIRQRARNFRNSLKPYIK